MFFEYELKKKLFNFQGCQMCKGGGGGVVLQASGP